MSVDKTPDWFVPPEEGFFAADLDRLPDLPPHTELIDGSLVFVSPQRKFHAMAIDLLRDVLRRASPADLRVRREMTIVIGPRNRPEPDVLVISAEADDKVGPKDTAYPAQDVVLAVEVVSPDSEERDRKRKPLLYAEAGIPHFWLVEDEDGRPVVYTHERNPVTGVYVATGVHRDRLKVSAPFAVDVDLTEIDRM